MAEKILRPALLNAVPGLVAGFTTRAFAPQQEPLEAARARLAAHESFGETASAGQVHGADVAVVTAGGHVPAHDGLVTTRAGVLLTTVSADCALVLLADPEAGVVGACHAGWRGAVAGVLEATLGAMTAHGARPERLLAYLAPCISAEAFEVGEEVASQFPAEAVLRQPEWPRPHVDLRAFLHARLRAAGVPEGHLEQSMACTARETGRFYSYRAENGQTGRMIGFIGRRAQA
ncbi:MAG: polyphenol oxidase family protein [Rubricoccaceae bacterium]